MPIAVLLDPNEWPNRTQDQETFDNSTANVMQKMPVAFQQLNALEASIGIIAGGSANKIPYRVDLNTTMADPVTGWMRLNSATQNAATAIAIDVVGGDSVDYTSLIGTFTGSTSAVLGQIRIEKQADASKFLVFALTAMTTPTGYRQLTVVCIGYSSASPFAQGDPVVFSYSRTGDKGDTGVAASFPNLYVRCELASNTQPENIVGNAWITRTLTTVRTNSISGASLASNQVTLPAGTYEYDISSPGYICNVFKARLYNVTDGIAIDYGTPECSSSVGSANSARSFIRGQFTISAQKTLAIQQNQSVTQNGGVPSGIAGVNEIYTEAHFKKIA
jgi:hypothetical protein